MLLAFTLSLFAITLVHCSSLATVPVDKEEKENKDLIKKKYWKFLIRPLTSL